MTVIGAGYCRVSTKEQAEKHTSVPAQEDAARKYAAAHDISLEHVYIDEGISGYNRG